MKKKEREALADKMLARQREARDEASDAFAEIATRIRSNEDDEETELMLIRATMYFGEARGFGNAAFDITEDEP